MPRPVEARIHPTPFISNAMKIRIRTGFAAALCLMLASCYPYPENPQQKKANQAAQRQTAAEQAKLKEQEALKKQQDELKKSQETLVEPTTPGTTDPTTPPPPQPPVEQKRADYPFANKVPGKEGARDSERHAGAGSDLPGLGKKILPRSLRMRLRPGPPDTGQATGSGHLDPVFFYE